MTDPWSSECPANRGSTIQNGLLRVRKGALFPLPRRRRMEGKQPACIFPLPTSQAPLPPDGRRHPPLVRPPFGVRLTPGSDIMETGEGVIISSESSIVGNSISTNFILIPSWYHHPKGSRGKAARTIIPPCDKKPTEHPVAQDVVGSPGGWKPGSLGAWDLGGGGGRRSIVSGL